MDISLVCLDYVVIDCQRREVVTVVRVADVAWLAHERPPRRDEAPEGSARVPLEAPRRRLASVVAEELRQHLRSAAYAKELGMVAELRVIVR